MFDPNTCGTRSSCPATSATVLTSSMVLILTAADSPGDRVSGMGLGPTTISPSRSTSQSLSCASALSPAASPPRPGPCARRGSASPVAPHGHPRRTSARPVGQGLRRPRGTAAGQLAPSSPAARGDAGQSFPEHRSGTRPAAPPPRSRAALSGRRGPRADGQVPSRHRLPARSDRGVRGRMLLAPLPNPRDRPDGERRVLGNEVRPQRRSR
jgi:hypothetical protein